MENLHNLEFDGVPNDETLDQSFEFADGSELLLFHENVSKSAEVESSFDQNVELTEESNYIESFETETVPIDFLLSEREVSKTFIVRDDGTLHEVYDGPNKEVNNGLSNEVNNGLTDEVNDGLCDEVNNELTDEVNDGLNDELNDGLNDELNDEVCEPSKAIEKSLTRKRRRNPTKWACNVAQAQRQSGKSYKNRKGETRRARNVKAEGCASDLCPLKCMDKIDMEARLEIFNSYWNLDDKEKRHFYAANVKKSACKRKRTKAEVSRKSYNLRNYFNYFDVDIEVCQEFFNNTLDINKGRVYYFFSKASKRRTVTPGPATHGKQAKKQGVRDHINKFPAVESHYCRANTKKLYLDQGLNVTQMYRMYSTETQNPVKESAYRNIFDYEFNFSFFRPKKDRCDKCVESTMISNPSDEQLHEYNLHRARKEKAHAERNKDRELTKDKSIVKIGVVSFDMENVFQMPIANASQLFYLRKFGVYVLTVFFNKTVYNVMWNEFICGREGTHLASALVKGLTEIMKDNPQLEQLILWSDSCVPQNRNSYMSAALQNFLKSETSGCLQQIDHKYSEAGHGEVQEVDNVHSVIERFIRHKFLYSPVSLIKEFLKIQSAKLNFKLLQMSDEDYFDYQALALASNYSGIPYTKVVHLRYRGNDSIISYKLDYAQGFTDNEILLKSKHISPAILHPLEIHSNVSNVKIADLRKMFSMMPEIDRNYYVNEIEKLMSKRELGANEFSETITTRTAVSQLTASSTEVFSAVVGRKPKRSVSRKSGGSAVTKSSEAALPKFKPRMVKVIKLVEASNGKASRTEGEKSNEAPLPKSKPRMAKTIEAVEASNGKFSRTEGENTNEAPLPKSKPRMAKAIELVEASNGKASRTEGEKSNEAPLPKSKPRMAKTIEVVGASNGKVSRIEGENTNEAPLPKSKPRMAKTIEAVEASNGKFSRTEGENTNEAPLPKSKPRMAKTIEVVEASNGKASRTEGEKSNEAPLPKSKPRMAKTIEVVGASNGKVSRTEGENTNEAPLPKSKPRMAKTIEVVKASNGKASRTEGEKSNEAPLPKSKPRMAKTIEAVEASNGKFSRTEGENTNEAPLPESKPRMAKTIEVVEASNGKTSRTEGEESNGAVLSKLRPRTTRTIEKNDISNKKRSEWQ